MIYFLGCVLSAALYRPERDPWEYILWTDKILSLVSSVPDVLTCTRNSLQNTSDHKGHIMQYLREVSSFLTKDKTI